MIAVLLAFAFLIGVVTSSTAVSIMGTYGLFFFAIMLYIAHQRFAAALSTQWAASLIHTLYWIVPKTTEIGGAVIAFVSPNKVPGKLAETLAPAPFLTTAAFGLVCLAIASWLFHRKEF